MSGKNNFCKGKNKQRQPCGALATKSGYCYFHSNPGVAAELGRVGGRKNRHVATEVLRPLPAMDSMCGVRAANEQMIAGVYGNELDHRKAAGLAALMNTQLRALAAEEMERKFQAQLDELSDKVTKMLRKQDKED